MAVDTTVRGRRPAALLGAAGLVLASLVSLAAGSAARAADTPRTGLGADGQKLTVSASARLDPAGETVRVTGSGYDASKGVYVALCKDNGDNRIPSPCLGGADVTGGGSASKWIVPADDPYAGDLAQPWGAGGGFDVDLELTAKDSGLDCLQVSCAIVTRVDHRASGDRSQDVRVPVTFEGQDTGGGNDGGGDGVDVPPGTVGYPQAARFTTAGKPLDLLLHPDSGKLYVGADNIVDTADVNEQGLYVLNAADGTVLDHISQAPGSTGTLAGRRVTRIAAPLAGDGVVFHYPLRGIGTAQDGDESAGGVWLGGTTVTGVGPGTGRATTLVQQGGTLSEIDTATGTALKTLTLDGGTALGVDGARGLAWSGVAGGRLSRVDTGSFTVTAETDLPAGTLWFVAPDPATGNVWVGSGNTVRVYDQDATLLTTIEGEDRAVDVAFDTATGRAFVVRQDSGDTSDGGDNDGSLAVYDTASFEAAAEPTALPGNQGQLGQAAVAVAPGGTTVYVTSPAEATVTAYERRMSPKVVQSPTDRSAAPGDEVAFVAAAEGAPQPTVRWQVSADGGQTWSPVENATATAYTFTARTAQDGYQYRAEFTNSAGTTRTSPVTLTVTEESGGGDEEEEPREPSGTKTVTGPEGQRLTVTPVNDLATENQTLKVTGSGYDQDKGVYVALCVDNGEGELPTPCVGGVDMTGASHSSAWISSDPPDYGQDLATPYDEGGSFAVELTVDAKDEFTDCLKSTCMLATRADHTRSGDRSQDVKVPVGFTGQDPVDTDDPGTDPSASPTSPSAPASPSSSPAAPSATSGGGAGSAASGGGLASTGVTVAGTAALAAALVAGGWLLYRRGRATTS